MLHLKRLKVAAPWAPWGQTEQGLLLGDPFPLHPPTPVQNVGTTTPLGHEQG